MYTYECMKGFSLGMSEEMTQVNVSVGTASILLQLHCMDVCMAYMHASEGQAKANSSCSSLLRKGPLVGKIDWFYLGICFYVDDVLVCLVDFVETDGRSAAQRG